MENTCSLLGAKMGIGQCRDSWGFCEGMPALMLPGLPCDVLLILQVLHFELESTPLLTQPRLIAREIVRENGHPKKLK